MHLVDEVCRLHASCLELALVHRPELFALVAHRFIEGHSTFFFPPKQLIFVHSSGRHSWY